MEVIEDSVAKILKASIPSTSKEALTASNSRRLTIAIDFDGVIAEYDGWKGADVYGAPRPDVVAAINVLRNEGWKIIIHTTRQATTIVKYLAKNHIPYDEINCNSDYHTGIGKPVATVYWDDRAFRYSGDARRDLEQIRHIRTWNDRR